jgi:hypothetical protein
MLSTLSVIDISIPGRIEIGYRDGFESQKSVWMQEKGYDFMGVTDSELNSILSNFEASSISAADIIRNFIEVDDEN